MRWSKWQRGKKVDALSSKIIHDQMKTLLLGNSMHVRTQSLKGVVEPYVPHGLSVVNTYTKVISGSKWVAVVVKNLTWLPQSLLPRVLKVQPSGSCKCSNPSGSKPLTLWRNWMRIQGIQQTKMMVEQRKKLLFQQLDSSGLDKWSDRNQVAAQAPWVSQYLFPGAWRVRLYRLSKTWDQGFWHMYPTRRVSEEFPLQWWMKSVHMWRGC